MTQHKEHTHIAGLVYIGACHYCSTIIKDARIFCDSTCKQFFIEEAETQAEEDNNVTTERKA